MSNLKVQDLRIGNFVYGLNEFQGTALSICSLHSDNTLRLLVGKDSIGCFYANAIEPIELDFDWLGKFGFEKYEDVVCNEFESCKRYVLKNVIDGTSNFEVHIIYSNYGGENHTQWCYSIDNDERFYPINSKLVHTLQNSFFLIAGYELECQ